MTLIVAAYNDKDIVIGSDTLTTVELDGARQPDINGSEKITQINKKAALAVSGYMTGTSKQFIADFCYANRKEKDVSVLRNSLLANIAATLTLDRRERFQITLVGFSDKQPQIKLVALEAGKVPSSLMIPNNFFAIGFDNPYKRAKELLVEKGVTAKPSTKELKVIVQDVLNTCINEFKDSEEEKLGGVPDIKILRKN